MHDFQYAFRVLRKSHAFTSIAILALALGIGANAAIFSVVNALFLRPLPYPDAGRLVQLHESLNGSSIPVSYPNYADWRKQVDVFEDMASDATFSATMGGATPQRIDIGYVSSGFFSILRLKPALGRDFTTDDDRPGAAPVVLLTDRIWRSRFNGDAAVLGRPVSIDKRPYTVIGILPAGFHFHRSADLYIPITDALERQFLSMRANHNNNVVIARFKPAATMEQARAQMDTVADRLQRAYPDVNTGLGIRVVTLREQVAGGARNAILMLLAAVGLVLLIACVNVANLLLARAAGREKEMAIRAAVGASRWRVVRQLLAESALLALAGGGLGILLARWSFAGLVRLVPSSVAAGGLTIDGRVLGFTLLVSLATGLLFGLAPAFDAMRLNLSSVMRDGTRSSGGGSSRGRLRDALVVAEVALALVLLAGAGLLIRTLDELMSVRLGFSTERTLTMQVDLPDAPDLTPLAASMFFEGLVERVQAMPGVESVGAISALPLSGNESSAVFYRDDRPLPPRAKLPSAANKVATPGYFRVLHIPLIAGRIYNAGDGRVGNFRREQAVEWFQKHSFAVVINQTMARRFWPGEDPVGKTFCFGYPEMKLAPMHIVGVVGDTRDHRLDAEPAPAWYFSSYLYPFNNLTLVVRTRNEPLALAASVRRAAAALDSSALVSDVTTLEQTVARSVASRRVNMLVLAIFAGLALALAAVGIYGVMAYTVTQRRHEIGIRMALGAARGDVLRLVLGKAILLGTAGVALGGAAALGLTRLMASMLYGVKAADPLTFGCVAAVLFAVTVAASYAPAWRATRLDPLAALRCE